MGDQIIGPLILWTCEIVKARNDPKQKTDHTFDRNDCAYQTHRQDNEEFARSQMQLAIDEKKRKKGGKEGQREVSAVTPVRTSPCALPTH